MKPKLYLETSFISDLTAQPSRDLVTAGRQEVTREWWQQRRADFHLYTSELVIEEAGAGDTAASKERLSVLRTLPLIALTEAAVQLADDMVETGPLPRQAAADALHISVAVIAKIDYLLTWNFKHLANAFIRRKVEAFCFGRGYEPCMICTPEEIPENEP